ncbi:MAG: tryptophan--tRNA ligase, partial [Chlamydiia bacterium]|nr:tryptophan--tRNA ligase [Chlamydiia bacterium]
RQMVLDYLAAGIDPDKAFIYLQSAIPQIYELNLIFEMLVPINHLQGLPSIKEMAKNAHIDDASLPFGLVGYPVLQAADILLARSHVVPIGKDNEAHVELTRSIARRFNALYGEVFPIPAPLLSDVPSLVGLDNRGKMSKSAGNAIFLSDTPQEVEKKVWGMYTDPNRIHADDPGTVEGNPVFTYHDLFNSDKEEVASLKERYREGKVGDVEVKRSLAAAINSFLEPMRMRRTELEAEKGYVEQILYEGTEKMRAWAKETMDAVHQAMGIGGHWKKISRAARERAEKMRPKPGVEA